MTLDWICNKNVWFHTTSYCYPKHIKCWCTNAHVNLSRNILLVSARIWELAICYKLHVTFSLSFSSVAMTLAYYGLSLATPDLGGNIFINCFISGAVEIPAVISVFLLFKVTGRIKPYTIYFITAGVLILLSIPVPKGMLF